MVGLVFAEGVRRLTPVLCQYEFSKSDDRHNDDHTREYHNKYRIPVREQFICIRPILLVTLRCVFFVIIHRSELL